MALDPEVKRLRKNLYNKIYYYNNKYGYDIDSSFVRDLSEEELRNFDTQDLNKYLYTKESEAEEEYEEDEESELQYEYEEYEEPQEDEPYIDFPEDYDVIIDEFRQSYSMYDFDKTYQARGMLDRWLDGLIESKGRGDIELGKKIVAKMIEDARADGLDITPQEMYSNKLSNKINMFMSYLPEEFAMGTLETQNLMEYIEYGEGWGDIE